MAKKNKKAVAPVVVDEERAKMAQMYAETL